MLLQESATKSQTAKLQQYCKEHELGDPDFAVIPTQGGGGCYCRVTIAGESYNGLTAAPSVLSSCCRCYCCYL